MYNIKSLTQLMLSLGLTILALTTISCGGAGGGWNDFHPRAATSSDFASKSFEFTWLPDGNPIHPDLGFFSITFSALDGSNQGTFSIQEIDAGSVTGNVEFSAPNLIFTVTSKSGDIPLAINDEVTNKIEADLSDGRIRLTNETTGHEVTSDPD